MNFSNNFQNILPPSLLPPQVVSESSASEPESSSQVQSGDELALEENEEEAKMQKGRQFVYQELVATEKDYIRDLECVVNVSLLLDHFRRLKYLSCNVSQ